MVICMKLGVVFILLGVLIHQLNEPAKITAPIGDVSAVVGPVAVNPTPTDVPVSCGDNCLVFEGINAERKARKLEELKFNLKLESAAKAKACDMRDHHYFSHKDLYGNWSWHLFIENQYAYVAAGENLSIDISDINITYRFMISPTHKENILNPQYKDIGIFRCGTYVAVEFGATN